MWECDGQRLLLLTGGIPRGLWFSVRPRTGKAALGVSDSTGPAASSSQPTPGGGGGGGSLMKLDLNCKEF